MARTQTQKKFCSTRDQACRVNAPKRRSRENNPSRYYYDYLIFFSFLYYQFVAVSEPFIKLYAGNPDLRATMQLHGAQFKGWMT